MKRTVLFGSVAVTTVGAVALWWSVNSAPVVPQTTATGVSAATAQPSDLRPASIPPPSIAAIAATDRATCQFSAGSTLQYDLELDSTLKQLMPGATAPVDVKFGMTAQLQLQVLRADDAHAIAVGRLANLKHSESTSVNAQAMAPTFLVDIDSTCQLTRFARHTTTSLGGARNQQSLLWDTQFRAAPSAQFLIRNGTGETTASLTREAGGLIRRGIARYDRVWGARGTQTTQADLAVQLGAGPWFDVIDSREQQDGGTTTLTLRKSVGANVAFADAERLQDNYVWGDFLEEQPKNDLVHRPLTSFDLKRQQRVATMTTEQMLADFSERATSGVGIQERWPDLSAYFEVHPDSIGPAIERYLAQGLPTKAAGDFFLALGQARTPVAKNQLFELKRNHEGVAMDRVRSMFALVGRDDVGPEFASELATDITMHLSTGTPAGNLLATESMLALGMFAGTRDNAQISEVAHSALAAAVAQPYVPGNLQQIAGACAAIGNTGDPSLLAAVEPLMRHPNINVRKAAAEAFLRMPRDVSDPIQVDWLRAETSPFVKSKIYSIAQQQHHNLGPGASRLLVNQAMIDMPLVESLLTRRNIVRLLAQSEPSQDPDVREALKAQAKVERAKHSTLLKEFATVLTRDEVAEVLR